MNAVPPYIIASYFAVWPLIMVVPAWLCALQPRERFNPDSFLFKERRWEDGGRLYERVFFIKKWKNLLPDGAALFKNGFPKKKLHSHSAAYLEAFVRESCRAELTHIPPLFLFSVFALYNPPHIVAIMAAFALITNLPCILAQRYNRIRLRRLLEHTQRPAVQLISR